MTLLDLFARDATGPLDLSNAPTDAATSNIRHRAQQLVSLQFNLDRAEALVEAMKIRKRVLERDVLPTLMDQAQTDMIGLADANADVIVQDWAAASIPLDWDEDRRAAAFAEMEAHGGGDLITANITIPFMKEDIERARRAKVAIEQFLTKLFGNDTPPPVGLNLAVHHMTLTSWIKSVIARRTDLTAEGAALKPINYETMGATIGRICRVVKRKVSKPKSRKRGR